MSKVYGVFFSKTAGILAGYGGGVGNPLKERKGSHLPGGGIKKVGKNTKVQLEVIKHALAEEVMEEFGEIGIKELAKGIEGVSGEHIFPFESYGHQVYIVFILISEDTGMKVDGNVIGGKSTNYDQCFKEVKFLHVTDILRDFDEGTDWFVAGIKEMGKRYFNGLI